VRPEPGRREHLDSDYHRVDGDLLLQLSREASAHGSRAGMLEQAESCLTRALDIARWQQAKLLELRAARPLALLREVEPMTTAS
jgi:hypothetical protein